MPTDPKAILLKLNKNLNILLEREAKYAGNVPLELLSQINDHRQAVDLTQQAIIGELTVTEWWDKLKPLLVSLPDETRAIFDQHDQYIETQYNVAGDLNLPLIGKPLQRPPRAIHFTDRERELDQVLKDLQPGRVVTLCGPGGIGKTALATEAIWRLAPGNDPPDRFPDGIISHSFYNQPQVDLALEHIARTFGEEPRPTPRDAAQRVLDKKQALLLLDGTETADDLPTVMQVCSGCGVLVTSRATEDAEHGWQDLVPLPVTESVDLLQAWMEFGAVDKATAMQICELVGRLPLAVRLVGRYLSRSKQSAESYRDWLQTSPLDALDQGRRQMRSVPLLIERSLQQVSQEARQTLALIGLLTLAPFEAVVVEKAFNIPSYNAGGRLGELVSYGLVVSIEGRFEVSHALIHTYATERLETDQEMKRKLVVYYTTLVEEQSTQGLEGYKRLDDEREHIIRVLGGCVEGAEWDQAMRLVSALRDYLDLQGHATQRVNAFEMGIIAAQQSSHRANERAFLNELGLAYYDLGQVEKAIGYYEQALTIACETGNRQGEENSLGYLGTAYLDLGQVEKAIDYYEKGLVIARESGYQKDEGSHLGNLGNAYRDLGQVEKAIDYCSQGLAIAREIGHRQGEGDRLSNLGNAYRGLGQVEEAIDYYEQALTIAEEIGDRRGQGNRLGNLGNAYRDLGQVEKAIDYYEKGLAIAEEIGDRRGQGNRLGNLGNAYRDLGQVEKAIDYYEKGLAIAYEIGHQPAVRSHLGNLGITFRILGQMDKAIEYHQQAQVILH